MCPHLVIPICCSPFLSLLKVISAVLPRAQDAVPSSPLAFPYPAVLNSPSSMESLLLASCSVAASRVSSTCWKACAGHDQESSKWVCAPWSCRAFKHLCDIQQSLERFADPEQREPSFRCTSGKL